MRPVSHLLLVAGLTAGIGACSDRTGPEPCVGATAVALDGGNCLDLRDAGTVGDLRVVLEQEVAQTFASVNSRMTINGVRVRIIADATGAIPEVGIGGFAQDGHNVQIFANPDLPDLEEVLRRELVPMLAHELHHAKRMRGVGYGATLLQAAVSEGMADRFSVEIAGIAPPPWSVALVGAELDLWIDRALADSGTGYDHARWFFGDADIPRWAGYAIGFELVGRYLEAHPGERASTLYNEPAMSFIPLPGGPRLADAQRR